MRQRERYFRLYFPAAILALWLLGVYVSDMVRNWVVQLSLLVASDRPALFALPMSDMGMNFRTIGALLGVLLVFYAAGFWCDSVEHDRDPIDDAPPARSQVKNANSMMDPMMGGMGYGGGMGFGGGFDMGMPPDPMSPPPGKFG